MKVASVRIENILGIDLLEFEAGKFNTITGDNGLGKTSALEAIKAGLGRGEDATLLRKGAEKGEIVLVLDNGTMIRKRVTATGSSTVVERDGVRVPQPASTIKALTDALAVNPVEFLNAPKKYRVSALLESLPISIDNEHLSKIVRHEVTDAGYEGMGALDRIDMHIKAFFDERTSTNRAVREKEGTINQLSATLPDEGEGADSRLDATEIEDRLQAIDDARAAREAEIDTKRQTYQAEHTAAEALIQSKIDAAQAALDAARAEMTKQREWWSTTQAKAQQAVTDARTKAQTEREPLSAQLAAVRNAASAAAKAVQTRQTIKVLRAEADELKEDAALQTKTIEDLEAYKSKLLASVPIDGLEVKDGEIYRHGVPFDTLNTAQQVQIAVEVAKLRSGDLGVMCVDGLESLSDRTFNAFREAALTSGVQMFVTRVSNHQFGIEAE